jgi:hypothetical protein
MPTARSDGLSLLARNLPYQRGFGNGQDSRPVNAWGKGTSSLWIGLFMGQAPLMYQDPLFMCSGECQERADSAHPNPTL